MAKALSYNARDYGPKEEAMMVKYWLQKEDAKNYFERCIKPRLDRAYKLYISYSGDRDKEIKGWQANVSVPYIHAVVETLMPRILDARPEFGVQGRNEDDQHKAGKIQKLSDYTWEKAQMDSTSEMVTRSSLIYGTGFLQVSWKLDKRVNKFLKTKDLSKKKYKWEEKEQIFYDAPYAEWVDNYALWYDWHNVPRESKQFWFKRAVMTGAEIKRKYPHHDKDKMELALNGNSGELKDYASIRNEVKLTHEKTTKGAEHGRSGSGTADNIYETNEDPDLRMHEVFQWWRPFDDEFAIMVNDVPILKGGSMPNPYNFKEIPFIDFPYLKLPNEFEGYGIPMILESPQIMMNMIKNQRLDSMTLSIHKMWIVNPLANIDKRDLVTRPFGIIYSTDPAGVREVEFSDIKASAYKEEELLKSDMRYASGVDDFSMGAGGGGASATEVRHLRESTLERVRLFVNHLGDGYGTMMRYWISMWGQFYTDEMIIRIIGDDGKLEFPLIEKDDLMGEFDFVASVIPSIAGKNDIDKKQGMDLFQLLINLPFIDPRKLTSKVLHSWNWDIDNLSKEEEQQQPGMPGMPGADPNVAPPVPGAEGLPPEMQGMMSPADQEEPDLPRIGSGDLPASVIQQALSMLGGSTPEGTPPGMAELGAPINLLKSGGLPPTVPGVGKTTNLSGANRGGKVNTNISTSGNSSGESSQLGQAANIQS